MTPLSKRTSLWIAFVLLHCIVQLPIGESFVWDDELLVSLNPWTRDSSSLLDIWNQNLWKDIPGEHLQHWYRPLMALHLIVDQHLLGDSVHWRQWCSLGWLILANALLLDWLSTRLTLYPKQQILLGILLSVSYINTELVHFIAARNDTMALAFALLSMRAVDTNKSTWVIGVFALCSLLSKETGLLYVVSFGAVTIPRDRFRTWLYILTPIMIWLGLRWFAISESSPTLSHIEWTSYLSNVFSIPFRLFTFNPSALSPLETHGWWPFGLVVLIALHRVLPTNQIQIQLILVATLCFSALTFEQSQLGGFRYLHLPYLAFAGLCVWMANTSRKQVLLIGYICWKLVNTAFVKQQWQNNQTLWEYGYHTTPTSLLACGSFMHLRPHPNRALERLSSALEPPVMTHCCAQAARYPMEVQDTDSAIQLGEKAIQNGCPSIAELYSPLALAYAMNGQWTQSVEHITQVSHDPFGYKAVIEVAMAIKQGDGDMIDKWVIRGIQRFPTLSEDEIRSQLLDRATHLIQTSHSQSD